MTLIRHFETSPGFVETVRNKQIETTRRTDEALNRTITQLLDAFAAQT